MPETEAVKIQTSNLPAQYPSASFTDKSFDSCRVEQLESAIQVFETAENYKKIGETEERRHKIH